MFIKLLTIMGLSLPFFVSLLGLYNMIWNKPDNKRDTQKEKQIKYKFPKNILLLCLFMSFAMGYASFCVINHGKEKENALVGYVDLIDGFGCAPSYVVHDSRAYYAFTPYEDMYSKHKIVLSNTNDIDLIINSIDVVIDDYSDITLLVYSFIVSGMGSREYDVFYGSIQKYEKVSRLQYGGEGLYSLKEYYQKQNTTRKYMMINANDEAIVIPYAEFYLPGLYNIHYEVNYSINGKMKKLVLPQQSMYIVSPVQANSIREIDYEKWYIFTRHSYQEFEISAKNGTELNEGMLWMLFTLFDDSLNLI